MVWKGVIIEESLENSSILKLVKIVNTKKGTLETETGILQFHQIEVDDNKKDEFVQSASDVIKQGWYIHICKDGQMIVIFKNNVFSFNKEEKDRIEAAKNYGMSIGIIREQLDFEYLIDNPYG